MKIIIILCGVIFFNYYTLFTPLLMLLKQNFTVKKILNKFLQMLNKYFLNKQNKEGKDH